LQLQQGRFTLDTMSNNTHHGQPIELRAVSRAYPTSSGYFPALTDVSLSIPQGTFAAVVGRSGSGKSTLVNLIAGLDRSTTGEIWVGETAVHTMTEDQLAIWRGLHVGVVFQSFQLLPTLTIAENVMLPMDFCSKMGLMEARARALQLLERVGICDQADKLPQALSGGQQQRAAIARALANGPELIVADEPTGNLDAHTATMVLDLLGQLAKDGRTVLMVTHERDVSDRVHRVIYLCDGRITQEESGLREVACA
jgi:putative ABC transport system ATP-binding protein